MTDPADSKTIGYHLFVEPTGTLAEELSTVIQNLSKEYGGPIFTPHATLLAKIPAGDEEDILVKSQRIAEVLPSFILTLGDLDGIDSYFKALYIQIVEKEEMSKHHALANEVFSMSDEGPYAAHVSLLYGNYPAILKEHTMAELSFPKGASFQVDRIHLYRTEGETSKWVKLREFELGG